MEKTVLLFRHGEPSDKDCCKGNQLNCELSAEGERQTLENVLWALFACRNQLEPTLVVTSPLTRACRFGEVWKQQQEQLSLEPSQHLILPDFTDIGVGEWEGKPWKQIEREYPEQFARVKDAEKLEIPGGENLGVFIKRIRGVWQEILTFKHTHVVVVGHSANNAVILADIGKYPLDFKSQDIGCVNKIEIDSSGEAHVTMHNGIVHHSLHECSTS